MIVPLAVTIYLKIQNWIAIKKALFNICIEMICPGLLLWLIIPPQLPTPSTVKQYAPHTYLLFGTGHALSS